MSTIILLEKSAFNSNVAGQYISVTRQDPNGQIKVKAYFPGRASTDRHNRILRAMLKSDRAKYAAHLPANFRHLGIDCYNIY